MLSQASELGPVVDSRGSGSWGWIGFAILSVFLMVFSVSGCTLFSDTEIPPSPSTASDVPTDTNGLGDSAVEETDGEDGVSGVTESFSIELPIDPEVGWRLGAFQFQFGDGDFELQREFFSQPVTGEQVALEMPTPPDEYLQATPFEEVPLGALFSLALYEDTDGDGKHTVPETMLGAVRIMLGYAAPEEPSSDGTWFGVELDMDEDDFVIVEFPQTIELEFSLSTDPVTISGTVGDLNPDADRLATMSPRESIDDLLPGRPVDMVLADPFSFGLPVRLPAERLFTKEDEDGPPLDTFGAEFVLAYADVDDNDELSSLDTERGSLCSGDRPVIFLYLPEPDNPADLLRLVFSGMNVGWTVGGAAADDFHILTNDELNGLVLSDSQCGTPFDRQDEKPDAIEVTFSAVPELGWRVALHLVHRGDDGPYVFEEEFISEAFTSSPHFLPIPDPRPDDLGLIDYAPEGAEGAMFIVHLFQDTNEDLTLSLEDAVVAVSRTMLVFEDVDEESDRWYSVQFSGNTESTVWFDGPDVTFELTDLRAGPALEISGQVDSAAQADRIASESIIELFDGVALTNTPVDVKLSDPFTLTYFWPAEASRITSEVLNLQFPVAVEFPIAYADRDHDLEYDFPEERIAYLCADSRPVAAVYTNGTNNISDAFYVVTSGFWYGWHLGSYQNGVLSSGASIVDPVFHDSQCTVALPD